MRHAEHYGKLAPAKRPPDVLLLAFAVLLVYGNSFSGSFQFDDYAVIVDNPAVASFGAWWQSMPGIRPLLKLSYALNWQLGVQLGWQPGDAWMLGGFHAFNVAVHCGNTLLLYALAQRLLAGGRPVQCKDSARNGARNGALLAALLFALHPVNTEAISLISGRSMALMSLFYLASLVLYLERRIALSLIAWALAMAVRETALTLPLALLLVERQRAVTNGDALSVPWRALRPYAFLGVVALVVMAAMPRYRHLADVSLGARPMAENLISQSGAVLYLLRQWLWPLALNADPLLPLFEGWTWRWLLSVGACLGFLLWAARLCWRGPLQGQTSAGPWFAFALLWFAAHLAPTNSLLPRLDLANERHVYLAAMGGCVLFGWGGAQLLQRWSLVSALLLGSLLMTLALLTHQRNQIYRDEANFWRDVTKKSPTNERAWNNLGYALTLGGQPVGAFDAYARALDLQPDDFRARLNQRALCRQGATVNKELARLCAGTLVTP
jgi:uncharacterized membrane protein YfbV (UPF0208 family)